MRNFLRWTLVILLLCGTLFSNVAVADETICEALCARADRICSDPRFSEKQCNDAMDVCSMSLNEALGWCAIVYFVAPYLIRE